MRIFVYLISIVLFSCGSRSSKVQSQEAGNVTERRAVYSDTNFASVFLDIGFSGEVSIFDKPNGKVFKVLKNNIDEDDFVMFGLLKKNGDMFYVVAYSSIDNALITKGWISKNNHLGIYSSTYDRSFVLYKSPNDKREILVTDKEYNPNIYEVVDFEGKWLKIKAQINGKTYEGWIPPDEQCSNVYSTCS